MRAAPAALAAVLITVSCTSGAQQDSGPSGALSAPPAYVDPGAAGQRGGRPGCGSADWPTYHGEQPAHRSRQRDGARCIGIAPGAGRCTWTARCTRRRSIVNGAKIVATENNTRVPACSATRSSGSGTSARPCRARACRAATSTRSASPARPPSTAVKSTVFVVAELANPIRHMAFGLDPLTGAQRWSRNVDVPTRSRASTRPPCSSAARCSWSGRRVYVPYGGLAGDCSAYRGSVVGVDLGVPTRALWHFTVPTAREAGIWTPPGPVENPGGGLLVSVGNGASGAEVPNGPTTTATRSSRSHRRRSLDSFSPTTWRDRQRRRPRPRIAGPGHRRELGLHRRQVGSRRTCCDAVRSAASAGR